MTAYHGIVCRVAFTHIHFKYTPYEQQHPPNERARLCVCMCKYVKDATSAECEQFCLCDFERKNFRDYNSVGNDNGNVDANGLFRMKWKTKIFNKA